MNMSLSLLILLLSAGASCFMMGLIWFVQVVHYPQFSDVAEAGFCDYHHRHTRLTTRVVGFPMLVELFTAAWLVYRPPTGLPTWIAWLGLGLVVITTFSTATLQVPAHNRLSCAFTPAVHRRLCLSNWIRTAAWSARAMLTLYGIGLLLNGR